MRCAVVGSGISGMTAALLLARLGHETTLLEAGPRLAPLLRGFTRQGLHFDTGFHYGGGLHKGGILRRWLRALGVWRHLRLLPQPHEDSFRFAGEEEIRLPSGQAAALRALEERFPGQGPSLSRFFAACDEELSHSPYTNPALRKVDITWRGQSRSLAQVLDEAKFPPLLRALLEARCLLYGTPPALAAWQDYALVSGPYFQSGGSFSGGGAALARAFAQELDAHGVRVLTSSRVTGIRLASAHNAGLGVQSLVVENGEEIPCSHCYFTGHPGQLQAMLPQGILRPAWFHRVRDMPETWPGLMLFAETDALPAGCSRYLLPRPHAKDSTPLVPDAWQDALFTPLSGLPDTAPSLYLACGHDGTEPDGDQPRRTALMVMALMRPEDVPAAGSGTTYADFKTGASARLAAHAETLCPELRGRWRVLECATAHSLRRWCVGSSGSLYGFRHDTETLPLLPVTRVPGLFLAGQNILLPGVLGGIVSAALAVGFAHGHEAALSEFRTCADNE